MERDLLGWIGDQFKHFGDIYKASIFGTDVYVTRSPADAEHVLRENWQNYVKGQAIKRVALLLGNGLMVSEGALWKVQRQIIQPAFHRNAISSWTKIMATANAALLEKWERAAQSRKTIDVTDDISHMVLEVVLVSIFGDDRCEIGSHFDLLLGQAARNLEFIHSFRSLLAYPVNTDTYQC